MRRPSITGLYYLTHIDNVASIAKMGILSHQRIIDEGIQFTPIYDKEIVSNRQHIKTPEGKSLWNYANVFFQPRNPMLYRVVVEKSNNAIVVIGLLPTILNRPDIFITNGNAAHSKSEIIPIGQGRKKLLQIVKATDKEWWAQEDGSKREIMAECLVPNGIQPIFIDAIYVANQPTADKVKTILGGFDLPVIREPKFFFQSQLKSNITHNLSLVEGDLFFSRMQTLTISVNTVGIMGKGLASRAKYQFPAVYVAYQDMCRNRKLRMGKPVVYTLESSLDQQLADEGETLLNGHLETKFLLFPTKIHWRNPAILTGIEQGLQWLQMNYIKEGIDSLAIPALGCGLGRLDWADVGPLMCRYLSTMNIPIQLYLPAEKKLSDEQLSREYLLGGLAKNDLF